MLVYKSVHNSTTAIVLCMLHTSATVYSSKTLLLRWNCGLVIKHSLNSSFWLKSSHYKVPELFPNRKSA